MQAYTLRSARVEAVIVPAEGGRVASLRSLRTGVEFLSQARSDRGQVQPGFDARFQDGPAAGIEECLPTVGRCAADTEGGPVPDHGDFWQVPWNVVSTTETGLSLEATGFSRPLRFAKTFALAGCTLSIHYRVTNLGQEDVSLLYACHPLFAIEAGDTICLPEKISRLRVDYSRDERMGAAGGSVGWPVTEAGYALDEAQSPETGFADMFYSGQLRQGSCGVYRRAVGQGVSVRFDPAELPYLGIWLCYGGWPDEYPRQYAVALEPTFAPVNTLKQAQDEGVAKSLRPIESAQWTIAFEVSAPGVSLEEFRAALRGGE